MHATTRSGRHRGAARYNPAAEFSTIFKSAGQTGIKVSVVLAASGGLVAAFALPAQAAPISTVSTVSSADSGAGVQALTAVPGVQALALAPAVIAPAASGPVKADPIGVVGVRAVAKPKPKPKPAPVVEAVSSRGAQSATASRTPRSSSRSTSAKSTSSSTKPKSTKPKSTKPKSTKPKSTKPKSTKPKSTKPQSTKPKSTSSTTRTVPAGTSGVLNIARSLLGIPYIYGGTTPAGFDCSGFTSYVFRKAGTSIPRTASAQQRAATRVSTPKPGDLVFYGSPAYHVGIYTGGGKMIDSPRAGKSTSERPMFSGVSGYGRF